MGTPLRRLQHFPHYLLVRGFFPILLGYVNPQNAASGAECTQFAVM